MRLTIVTATAGLLLLVAIVELLRRREIREKYGALWLVVGLTIVPLSFFPRLLDHAAGVLGIASGVSLILFLSVIFLLLVCIHLSWECSRAEEETRSLAEEIALLKEAQRRLAERMDAGHGNV